jgi:hypothetical protein
MFSTPPKDALARDAVKGKVRPDHPLYDLGGPCVAAGVSLTDHAVPSTGPQQQVQQQGAAHAGHPC